MRTLEFRRRPLDVRRRKYREVFSARYDLSLNMFQLYLHVLYGSRNKPRLFPPTALNDGFLKPCRGMFTARYGLSL
jgi:hypothetical protein